jgi:hypothetical protein
VGGLTHSARACPQRSAALALACKPATSTGRPLTAFFPGQTNIHQHWRLPPTHGLPVRQDRHGSGPVRAPPVPTSQAAGRALFPVQAGALVGFCVGVCVCFAHAPSCFPGFSARPPLTRQRCLSVTQEEGTASHVSLDPGAFLRGALLTGLLAKTHSPSLPHSPPVTLGKSPYIDQLKQVQLQQRQMYGGGGGFGGAQQKPHKNQDDVTFFEAVSSLEP